MNAFCTGCQHGPPVGTRASLDALAVSPRLYADLNSVSPTVKQSIARTIAATGAQFVEIAVMAPVPPYGHRVPMLAGGEALKIAVGSTIVPQIGPAGKVTTVSLLPSDLLKIPAATPQPAAPTPSASVVPAAKPRAHVRRAAAAPPLAVPPATVPVINSQ